MNGLLKKLVNSNRFTFKIFKGDAAKYIQYYRVKPWLKAKGDETLRLNYELSQDSVVFDMGGFEGQWSQSIYDLYQPNIYIFEPYKPYAENIRNRFKSLDKVKVFDFGLSNANVAIPFSTTGDSSSVYGNSEKNTFIDLKMASEFFQEKEISNIDLIKINIEGGEYDLLEHLILTGLIKKIKNIQVQFHDFILPDAKARMEAIQKELSKTHYTTYQYEFVWENWRLKE